MPDFAIPQREGHRLARRSFEERKVRNWQQKQALAVGPDPPSLALQVGTNLRSSELAKGIELKGSIGLEQLVDDNIGVWMRQGLSVEHSSARQLPAKGRVEAGFALNGHFGKALQLTQSTHGRSDSVSSLRYGLLQSG